MTLNRIQSRRTALLTTLVATLLAAAAPAGATPTPPGITSVDTARAELGSLTVAEDGSMAGYSRELFPHWHTVSGSCTTRQEVLKRDGDKVRTDSACTVVSGTWHSPYDGETWTDASDLDIDHVVPLAVAWRSGAAGWSTERREAFANDLSSPQLIAVTDTVNQAKGDQTPDRWKPPLTTYWCTYAKMWIHVKFIWSLTVNPTEKTTLENMLGRC